MVIIGHKMALVVGSEANRLIKKVLRFLIQEVMFIQDKQTVKTSSPKYVSNLDLRERI